MNLNKELYESVCSINLQKVKQLLKNHADPNYIRQAQYYARLNRVSEANEIYDDEKGKWCDSYYNNGSEIPDMELNQPTTPLKLCVFRFSDCLLSNSEQSELIQIAKMLIKYGAHTNDVLEYYIYRYGEKTEDDSVTLWYEFYKLLGGREIKK